MSTWNPLLDGMRAERAETLIDGIQRDILRAFEAAQRDDHTNVRGASDPWNALLYGYLWARDRTRDDYETAAIAILDAAIDRLEQTRGVALYGGVVETGWVSAHFANQWPGEDPTDDDDDDGVAIDELVLAYLGERIGPGEYDLISGLAGIGTYGLERAATSSGARVVEEVISLFDERHEDHPNGVTWFTPPELLPLWQQKNAPQGYYNLGVAHGVPGVLAVLAEACARGLGGERCRELLESGCSWLLAHRVPGVKAGGGFDAWIPKGAQPTGHSRSAWCYGSLGLSVTLLAIARFAGNADWEREAIDIALAEAALGVESGIKDGMVCHGASGNGHLFNRLFQATGDERFRKVALDYFDATFSYYIDGLGVGGFRSWEPTDLSNPDPDKSWIVASGFLTGSAGAGLALLAAVSDIRPDWDRVLLSHIPA